MILLICTEMLHSVTASQHHERMQAQWKSCAIHDRVVKPIDSERQTQSERLFSSLLNQIFPTNGPVVLI